MTSPVDVLVVGAGPTGLTLAIELLRHGASCQVIEKLPAPSLHSRALFVQARTLEIWDQLGIVQEALARGKIFEALNLVSYDRKNARIPISTELIDSPYPYGLGLPQDETERLLTERLTALGGRIERGVSLEHLAQDGDGVTATVVSGEGRRELRARWVVGCDGAHSAVRKLSGIPFDGATYEDHCVMADVHVEWALPDKEMHIMPSPTGVMGAFPMPGEHRYRIFCILPRDEKETAPDTAPLELPEFAEVVRRMSPVPVTLSEPRYLTRYRLHRRGVPRYREGRVFLAGDAAHIHSPAGGQGMNTGIQDAYNLAWKLALVARGRAADSLLDTYDAERHPVGQKLLQGTDRIFGFMASRRPLSVLMRKYGGPRLAMAFLGWRVFQRPVMRFVSQTGIRYRQSPLSVERAEGRGKRAVHAGDRAPDARAGSLRLFDLLRGPHHTVLLLAGKDAGADALREHARALVALTAGREELVHAHVIAWSAALPVGMEKGAVLDSEGALHRRYGADRPCLVLVRPDGYVGLISQPVDLRFVEAELDRRVARARVDADRKVASA